MSEFWVSTLPTFDRRLLSAAGKLVPKAEREEWLRAWQAELWHMHHGAHPGRVQTFVVMTDLAIGVSRDAFWLRTDSWRKSLSGTAILCIATLCALTLVCILLDLALAGSWDALRLDLANPSMHCLIAVPLVLFVAFASGSHGHIERTTLSRRIFRVKPFLFFAAKISQIIAPAFLLSVALCVPLHSLYPDTADLLQILFFVLMTLAAMRWAIQDQEQRCHECLQSLAVLARVGRPSHNLLEWNGTELSCKHGHGLLSVPEMETSWCRSSRWVQQVAGETE
jgi:hypothetical protein